MRRTIVGVENRSRPLDRDEFRFLETSARFRELVNAGVASLVVGRDPVRGVRCSAFVGQALLESDVRLVIEPKMPGTLESLLHWSLPEDMREVTVSAPSEPGQVSRLLLHFARRFSVYLGRYVQRGRVKEYRSALHVTSTPRGRISIRETVRLRARGRVGRVAVYRPELTGDIPVNRLLMRALGAAEALLSSDVGSRTELVRLRMYREVFTRIEGTALAQAQPAEVARLMEGLLSVTGLDEALRGALAYGRAVVLSLGTWPKDEWISGPPTSMFVNLSALWQNASIQAMRARSAADVLVHRGAMLGRNFIHRPLESIAADPDFVVQRGGHSELVGDCKYKVLKPRGKRKTPEPDVDDVYQLYAHTQAFGAVRALLLYPGDMPSRHILGETPGGIRIEWATVRPPELEADLASVMAELNP